MPSMAKPARTGPRKPEVEKASASKVKFLTRCSGPPITAAACPDAMWNRKKPDPASGLATNSVSRRGTAQTSTIAARIAAAPASIGQRTPARSTQRPQRTANSIAITVSSDITTPTVKGVAS